MLAKKGGGGVGRGGGRGRMKGEGWSGGLKGDQVR